MCILRSIILLDLSLGIAFGEVLVPRSMKSIYHNHFRKEKTMSEQEVLKIARETVEAFNTSDWERLKSSLAPDVVYDEVGTQRHMKGAGQVVESFQEWKKAGPDGIGTITKEIVSGNTVVLEVTWTATQNGPLVTPEGTIPPSGKPWKVEAAQVITVKEGKIKEVHQYFDTMTLLQQIGATQK